MRGWRHIARCWAVVAALALVAPAAALADSAGDQQYIDPLAGSTTSTASHTSPPPSSRAPSSSSTASAPAPTASAPPAPAPAATPSAPASAAPASAAGSTTTADPQPTLPYTGLNVWLCAAVGLGLVGAGLALRRLARAP